MKTKKFTLKLERTKCIAIWNMCKELLESDQKLMNEGKAKLYPEERMMFMEMMSEIAEQVDRQTKKLRKERNNESK